MAVPPRRPLKKPIKPLIQKPKAPTAPAAPTNCAKCSAVMEPDATFCGECGTPVKKGLKPKRTVAEVKRNLERGKNERLINEARRVLFWVALLNIGGGLIFFLFLYAGMNHNASLRDAGSIENDPEYRSHVSHIALLVVLLLFELPGAIFFGLYYWAKTSPLPATIAGLVTYISFTIAGIAVDPESAFSILGWLIRIAIVGALAKGIQSAAYEKKMRIKQARREAAERKAAEEAESAEPNGGAEPAVE